MNELNTETDESTIERRSILKATGAVAGASFLAGQATGQPDLKSRFVDVGLSYDVDTTIDGDWHIGANHVCIPGGYAVVDGAELVLGPEMRPADAVATLDGPAPVVSFGGFHPAPATLAGESRVALPVALDDTLETRRSLGLDGTVDLPQFTVATHGEDATVSVADESVSVAPGTEGELRLAPESVDVVASKMVDPGPDVEANAEFPVGKVEENTVVTREAEPVVTVRNYGEVDVFDAGTR